MNWLSPQAVVVRDGHAGERIVKWHVKLVGQSSIIVMYYLHLLTIVMPRVSLATGIVGRPGDNRLLITADCHVLKNFFCLQALCLVLPLFYNDCK